MSDSDALIHNRAGGYRFLPAAGSPYSAGIIADPGLDLVRVRFERPVLLDDALALAGRHLDQAGRPTAALAGFELRIGRPFNREEWTSFNAGYISRLATLGLQVDGMMSAARTNVAPSELAIAQPSMFAFTYTATGTRGRPAYILSGATEEAPGDPAANVASIVSVLSSRMGELGAQWTDATAVHLYGVDNVQDLLVDRVLSLAGAAAVHGIHWYPSLPPIEGLRLEIDVRSIGTEVVLPV